ncbi:MAG TPA: hypothetical protein PLY76_07940, partial [Flavobacteriales bacterium]|nr:hypothetical protein [Flavobacteriales bacterium]
MRPIVFSFNDIATNIGRRARSSFESPLRIHSANRSMQSEELPITTPHPLHFFTSSLLHLFTSSPLQLFNSSPLHPFTSSLLHLFTSSPLH